MWKFTLFCTEEDEEMEMQVYTYLKIAFLARPATGNMRSDRSLVDPFNSFKATFCRQTSVAVLVSRPLFKGLSFSRSGGTEGF